MDSEELNIPSRVKIYVGIIVSSCFLVGLVGNTLSIVSVCFYTKTATRVLYSITVNLFVSSLLLDIFYYPGLGVHVIKKWPDWTSGDSFCNWSSLVENGGTTVFVLTLLLLALDLYLVTIKRSAMSIKTIVVTSLLLWIASACLHSLYTFTSNPKKIEFFGENITMCNGFTGKPLVASAQHLSTAAFGNMVILAISSALVICTGVQVWRKKVTGPVKFIRQEFNIAVVLITFCWLLWLPKWLVNMMRAQGNYIESKILILSNAIGALMSVIPSIACMLFLKDFRRTIFNILKGKGKCSCLYLSNESGDMKDDGMNEPLSKHRKKDQYEDITNLAVFEKGHFKTSCNNNLDQISIDSQALEDHLLQGKSGHRNQIYEEQFESKF